MTSSIVPRTPPRTGGRFPRPWAAALALATVAFLAACGTSDVGVPPGYDDPSWEEQIGTQPGAIAVFAAELEADGAPAGFDVGEDDAASGGGYLVQPSSIAASTSGAVVREVAFEVPTSGTYALWARVYAPSLASDATYLGFDGATVRAFAPELDRYVWIHVVTEDLGAGPHAISLGHGEPGLRLDLVAVVRDPSVGDDELETLVRRGPRGPKPTDPPADEPAPEPVPAPSVPSSAEPFSLRGDAGFDAGALSAAQRVWHERSLSSVVGSASAMAARAQADNMYYYGRTLFQFSSSALLALRSTGDLRFLDALDPMMEALRGELYDGWCDGVEGSLYVNARYGTVVERDGFRNFRVRLDASRDYCRDVADLDEALTHGHLAMVMYAYHVNRDLPSPAGVDYGERADFWFEYLRDDFEAKWRSRTRVAWPDMDFIDLKFSHTYNVFTLYYYFMGKRLESVGSGDAAAYLARATSLTDAMFDQRYEPGERAGGFVPVSGPSGDAVVYSFGAPGRGEVSSTHLEATPTTYARYVMSAVLVMRLEGFSRWDDAIMMRLSNGLTGFVIDVPRVSSVSDTIAASVTGEEMVGGMPPTTYRSRLTVGKFGVTTMPAFAVWDGSGELEAFSLQAYAAIEGSEDQPQEPAIPTSMLFLETAREGDLGLAASP